MTRASIPLIHTTIGRLTDVTNARGLDKNRLILDHRRQAAGPPRDGGGNFYTPFTSAVRQGLLARDLQQQLRDLLTDCNPGQRPHFAELAHGALQLVRQHQVVGVVRATRGLWLHHGLEVNVTGLLGVQLATGGQEAWVLHMKPEPLAIRDMDVPLYVADALLASRNRPMHARVVDVRRARSRRIRDERDRAELRRLAQAEAEAYASLWRSAA